MASYERMKCYVIDGTVCNEGGVGRLDACGEYDCGKGEIADIQESMGAG